MKKILEFSYEKGKKILIARNSVTCKVAFLIIILLLFILGVCIKNLVLKQILFVGLYMMIVLFEILIMSDKILLSVIGFFKYGILYYVQLLGVLLLLHAIFQSNIVLVILSYTMAALLWWGFSLLANNKVGTLVNEVLSALLALFVLIKDLIISIIPIDILNVEYSINFMGDMYSYSCEQMCQFCFNIITMPFLVINIAALLLCTIKGYWIEKYNDGKDITQDMISDNKNKSSLFENIWNRITHNK